MSNIVLEECTLKVRSWKPLFGSWRRCNNFGFIGHGRSMQFFDKAIMECYACHKLGQFQWKCNKGVTNFEKNNQVDKEEDMFVMAYVEDVAGGINWG